MIPGGILMNIYTKYSKEIDITDIVNHIRTIILKKVLGSIFMDIPWKRPTERH